MALDANLFAQMGAKPKSMAEYGQEMDTDAFNALKIRAGGLEYQNALQAQQDDQAYRELAKTFGNDPMANYNALMQKGMYKQAQGYQKSVVDAEKDRANINQSNAAAKASEASAAKTQFETYQAKIGTGMKILQAGTNPVSLVQLLDQSVKAGAMTREEALQAVSDMPQDPQGFAQWRDKQLMQGMEMSKRLEAQARDNNNLIRADGSLNKPLLDAKKQVAASRASSTNVSYGTPMAGVDKDGNPVFFQPSKTGGPPSIVQGVAPSVKGDKPLTEAQAKAAVFKSQMEAAERELATNPIDQTKLGPQIDVAVASTGANMLSSPGAQRARQAQEQWAEAFLRFKTGAASTEAEVKRNVKTFFPQQGDSDEVIAQKKRMREQAVLDLGMAAGEKPPTKPAATTGGGKDLGGGFRLK